MRLAWFAAAWLTGILAGTFADLPWFAALAALGIPLAAGVALRDRRIALTGIGIALAVTAGIVRVASHDDTPPTDAVAHWNDGVDMRIRGVVRDDPDRGDTSQRFVIDAREIERAGVWIPASGGVQVHAALLPEYVAGDIVQLEGALESPPRLERFDYAGHLERRGIQSVMSFPSARAIGHDDLPWYRETMLDVRRALAGGLGLSMAEPQASLARGILLGERSALPGDVEDDLNATSTSHMVVVSGQNIVLVTAFVTAMFAMLLGRRRALVASVVIVLAYATLVGWSPPVMRATIMGLLLVLAQTSGRRTNGATSILAAAALMTALAPSIVRDVSFQLSFAATAAIVYLAAPVHHLALNVTGRTLRIDEMPRWTRAALFEPFGITVAAVLATAPLMALHFGTASLVALPANMLVVPLFPLMLLASLIAAVGGCLSLGHLAFGLPAQLMLSYWLALASALASLPSAAPAIGWFSTPMVLAVYASLASAVLVLLRRPAPMALVSYAPSALVNWRRVLSYGRIAAPLAIVALSAGFVLWPSPRPRLDVTVLEVGQGDSILIETPSGADILIDGGPGPAVLRALADEMPWHDRSLDLVVLTHPQTDHATGMIDVLERYDVRRVATGHTRADGALQEALDDAIATEGLRAVSLTAGDRFDLGDGVVLEVLSPRENFEPSTSMNDAGLVLRLSWNDVSFLFAADIERATEDALVASGPDLRSTVLKVPHHGSATSSSRAFLDAVQPSVSVVSAGQDNQFGHPDPDVVARLDDYGPVYQTGVHGSVRLRTDGHRVWID